MIFCDAVVAGAGPAGAVAAILLARAGLQIALVDRSQVGICKIGETLPSAGARLLTKLDLPAPPAWGSHKPIGGVISAWGGPAEAQDFLNDPDGPGWRLNRIEFENDLRRRAEEAGARRIEARVQRVERKGDEWRISTDTGENIVSALVVDATGRRAKLSRQVGAAHQPGPSLVAIWAVASNQRRPAVHTDRTLIEAQSDGWWYGAFLPDGRPIVAFHTSPGLASRLRADPASWRRKLTAAELLSSRISPALFETTRLRGTDARGAFLMPCYGDSWIACGDAAISFDPIASQGIFNALSTGEMAARALLTSDRQTACRDYGERLTDIWRIYIVRRNALYRRAARRFRGGFWHEAGPSSSAAMPVRGKAPADAIGRLPRI